MNLKFIRKTAVVATLLGAMLLPTVQVFATDAISILDIPKKTQDVKLNQNALINATEEMSENIDLAKELKIKSSEEVKVNKLLEGKVFVTVNEEGYLLVNETADENSACIGKVYGDSTVTVSAKSDEWSEISSGNVIGFVKTDKLILGKKAIATAKEILLAQYTEEELSTLDKETVEQSFSVGETTEEETARLAEEEAVRAAAEAARIEAERISRLEKGQSVVSYAKNFIGNPYVYGGTSLTRGTDCSGFVKGVYAKFGVSLPRTSYAMRKVGYSVSYSEIQPGDIVCYDGHEGIYAGNGQIVNAINENKGIGMSNARYQKIITIRRIF